MIQIHFVANHAMIPPIVLPRQDHTKICMGITGAVQYGGGDAPPHLEFRVNSPASHGEYFSGIFLHGGGKCFINSQTFCGSKKVPSFLWPVTKTVKFGSPRSLYVGELWLQRWAVLWPLLGAVEFWSQNCKLWQSYDQFSEHTKSDNLTVEDGSPIATTLHKNVVVIRLPVLAVALKIFVNSEKFCY